MHLSTRTICLSTLSIVFLITSAQSFDISGRVADSLNAPVSYAHIYLKSAAILDSSALNGTFRLQGTTAINRNSIHPTNIIHTSDIAYYYDLQGRRCLQGGSQVRGDGIKLIQSNRGTGLALSINGRNHQQKIATANYQPATLNKIAATYDTLIIIKPGFIAKKIALSAATANLGTITLYRSSRSRSRTIANLNANIAQKIIGIGTSLTGNGYWNDQLYAKLNTDFPGLVTVVNNGIGASSSNDGLANLQQKVLDLNPTTVLIEYSMNDAYLPYAISQTQSRANINTLIDRILARYPQCEIILQTMNECSADHRTNRPLLHEYYQIYIDVALERGLLYVNNYPQWKTLLNTNETQFRSWVPDLIHPHAVGYQNINTPNIIETLYNGQIAP